MYKKLLTSFFILILAVSAASAQTLEEILARYTAAVGGAERWKKVQTQSGDGYMQVKDEVTGKGKGIQYPVKFSSMHNKGYRVEFSVMGAKMVDILTPEGEWVLNPLKGDTKYKKSPDDEFNLKVDNLDLQDPFIDYAAKGSTVALLTDTTEDGVNYYRLLLTTKHNVKKTYYLDKKTALVGKIENKSISDGEEKMEKSSYSGYQLFNGYKMATYVDGGTFIIVLTTINVNPPVNKNDFVIPN